MFSLYYSTILCFIQVYILYLFSSVVFQLDPSFSAAEMLSLYLFPLYPASLRARQRTTEREEGAEPKRAKGYQKGTRKDIEREMGLKKWEISHALFYVYCIGLRNVQIIGYYFFVFFCFSQAKRFVFILCFYLFIFFFREPRYMDFSVGSLGLEQTFGDEPAIIKAHHTAYNHNKQSFICRTVCWQRCADWQERRESNRDGESEMSRLTNEMDDRGIGHKCARYIIACSPGARAQWHRFICTKPALTRRLLKVS